MKEPGQLAFDSCAGDDGRTWACLPDKHRAAWAAVEAAVRTAALEEAAKIVDGMVEEAEAEYETSTSIAYLRGKAAAIRALKTSSPDSGDTNGRG